MICAKMYTVEIYFIAVLLVSKFSRVGVFMCDWLCALSEKTVFMQSISQSLTDNHRMINRYPVFL